jgi:NAD dependent epimerase/dehydratase family enzyme
LRIRRQNWGGRMRVLIIGGTGFIGPWVVRHLVQQGHTVAVFHRGQTAADLPATLSHIYGERQNLSAFAGEFQRFGPDVAVDMFPYTEEEARLVMETFRGIAQRMLPTPKLRRIIEDTESHCARQYS